MRNPDQFGGFTSQSEAKGVDNVHTSLCSLASLLGYSRGTRRTVAERADLELRVLTSISSLAVGVQVRLQRQSLPGTQGARRKYAVAMAE